MPPSQQKPQTAAEAEREVAQTRGELAESIDELQERLNPQALVEQALTYLKGDGKTYGDALMREAKANPIAALMAGTGIAWLLVSASRRAGNRPDAYRQTQNLSEAERSAYRNPRVTTPPATSPANSSVPNAGTDMTRDLTTAETSSQISADRREKRGAPS